MEEKEYRNLVEKAFKTLERAFDAVDPDIAEFELAQGAVTILFKDKTKCILSTQPSVRQIWLAAASLGVAHHFNYDQKTSHWLDDKGQGVELLSYVRTLVRDTVSIDLRI